ncbi:hypothetical protein B0H13DRAFT_2324800 [Mycena leptocephala]|nr:hypothetical protein B0H13DRAFT_2324800 [Mycena leptocephala]
MFQHSQQPAPPEFNYHTDLLGDPLLFRVLVSSSLQPRHRLTPDAHAQAAAAGFHPRHPGPTSAPAFRTPAPAFRTCSCSPCSCFKFSLLLHSCAPPLTLLLRRADTHALACPLDLAPLAPYALTPRSLGLLRLELFRSCFRFHLGRLSLVAHICYIRSESIPDPSLFIPVLAFFTLDALASSARCSRSPVLLPP